MEPIYLFSDEFNSAVLDKRWNVVPADGAYSLTSQPGWLGLPSGFTTNAAGYPMNGGTVIYQLVPYLCDIDIKVHMDIDNIPVGETRSIILCDDGRWNFHPHCIVKYSAYRSSSTAAPQISVTLPIQVPAPGVLDDTCYFHMRMTNSGLYCSYSTDGVTYSNEAGISKLYSCISIGASQRINSGVNPQSPFMGYIDYIRFTNVSR